MTSASYGDKQLVVQILCDSFDSNKSVNYVVKQDKKRKARIKVLMEYSFDICYLFGEIVISDNKKGCALVLYPDKKKTTLKTILLDLKLALDAIGIFRITRVLDREKKIKSNYPSEHLLYLWFIGVSPAEHGKGIGKQLLSYIIKQAIEMKRPIYLETSMIENLDFYKKMGFEIYKELDLTYKLFLIRKNLSV